MRSATNSFGTYQQWFWIQTFSDEGIIVGSHKMHIFTANIPTFARYIT
jgi:hypothetical protein